MERFPSDKVSGAVQSIFRIVVGLLFASHGAAKLFGFFGGVDGSSGATVPVGVWPYWWAGIIELVGGLLVTIGLGTRVAALICSGSMAYAYFVVHLAEGPFPIQNGGELAALYSWLFLLIVVIGPGPFAVDSLWSRRPRPAETALSR